MYRGLRRSAVYREGPPCTEETFYATEEAFCVTEEALCVTEEARRVQRRPALYRGGLLEDRLEALVMIQFYRDCPVIAINPVIDYFCRKSSRQLRLTE